MARIKPIRITSNDVKEFERLARNTTSKIKRTFKNYGIDLSSEISTPKKVSDFKTRQEFNAWKEKARSLTNRSNTQYQFKKNKYGVVASVKEINELKRTTKRAQRIAKDIEKKASKLPYTVKGKKVSTIGQRMQQMGKPNVAGIHVPPDFDFNKIVTRKHMEEKKENLKERSDPNFMDKRTEKLKENYIKMIHTHYNSDGDEIVKAIEVIPANDFFELFLMHDELQFEYEYTEEQTEASRQKKLSIFENYEKGRINMDLKGF